MIILGIDPGTTRIGFGIIKKTDNNLECLDYGLLPLPSSRAIPSKELVAAIQKLTTRYKPDIAAIEKLFFFKNKKTVIAVSEMRGSLLTALSICNLPIQEFTPLQVKQAVSNYGRAGKDQDGP